MRDKPDIIDKKIHLLWINAGLSCDGESVALTSATQPSIEDIALGVLPGLPEVAFHWPFLDYESGPVGARDDFIHWFFEAEKGELDAPFMLVIEGSIPNEKIKSEGYWAAFGNDPDTGEPITTYDWVERLAPKALALIAAGTCATYGGIHAMRGNPTGAMGVADLLGWDFRTPAGIPIVNVPGCPTNPDNLSETILYLLYQATGQAPMIPLDEKLRPTWLFGATVHESCHRAGYYEQGDFAEDYNSQKCLVRIGCWGDGCQVQRPQARMDQRHRGLPQRRRHLHRLHDARVPRQVHAVHGRGRTSGRAGLGRTGRFLRRHDPAAALGHCTGG
jgi:hydrogenase small subunit